MRSPHCPTKTPNSSILALLHARAGRLDVAQQDLLAALRNDPDNRRARVNLGQIHLLLAAQAWQRALDGDARSGSDPDPALRRRLDALRDLLTPAPPAAGR